MTNPRQVEKQPILDRYIPAHPVDRYTVKKWNTDDWFRHNENKYFQSEQDRGQVGGDHTHGETVFGEGTLSSSLLFVGIFVVSTCQNGT